MSDSVSVEVKGLEDLLADLRDLPQVIQSRVMLGMVATGASVIRKDAIARAPIYEGVVAKGHAPPGTLKAAIYQVRLPELCTATREIWKIDVRRGKYARARGKAQRNLDAFYASQVEYGHYARGPGSLTKAAKAAAHAAGTTRWIAPHPFMRPAFEAKQAAAFEAMRDYLTKNLRLANVAMRIIKAS